MTDKSIQLKDASNNNLFPITNYNNNVNIPSINGVPLIGNKTLEEIAGASKGIKLLWENPSPTATFAAQTISISEDLTKYDFYLISYGADGSNYYLQTAIVWLGKQSQLFYMTWGGARYQRGVTVNDTSIVFGNATSNNSTSNGVAVPYQIYGVKNTGITSETISNKELLWSNSNPTSNFAAQTITVSKNTGDYDALLVVAKYSTTDNYYDFSLIMTDNIPYSVRVSSVNYNYNRLRWFTANGSSITISIAEQLTVGGSVSETNNHCIPIAIYGVHFGSKTTNQYNYSLPSVNNSNLVDLIYPIGSIYASTSSANPGTIVGGTWTALTQNNYATVQWPSSPTTVASGGNTSTTLNITTNGSPVYLSFNGDINPSGSGCWARAAIYRGTSVANGTLLARHTFQCVSSASYNETFSVSVIDPVPAGTYTYLFYIVSGSGAFVLNEESAGPCCCNAFELGADPSLYKWRRTS